MRSDSAKTKARSASAPAIARGCTLRVVIALAVLVVGDAGARREPMPPDPPTLDYDGPKPPWPRRRRRGVRMRARGRGLIDIDRWPEEPRSPKPVEVEVLAKALRRLCGWMPPARPRRYARWIVSYSGQFGVDPFVVAALVYSESLCVPHEHTDYGTGLTRLNVSMHRGQIRRRRYRYWTLSKSGGWKRRGLAVPKFLFYERNLRRAEPNIYFTAALLSIFTAQHPAIDGAFGSVPHRHAVSHMIWGDRVRDAGSEDRVLRIRRLLLRYYRGEPRPPRAHFGELKLHCPLDGWPRKVTSGMGDDRDDGSRRHKGIDISSSYGEPVRAIAAGRVYFAGVDGRHAPSRNMPSAKARHTPRSRMGAGGMLVMIRHEGGLISAYMHLSSYSVRRGDRVEANQQIGRVGRSGMRSSAAHLHFELRRDGKHLDPMGYLEPYLFGPRQTYLGRKLAWEQRRVRRKRRRRRRRRARQRTAHPSTPSKAAAAPSR